MQFQRKIYFDLLKRVEEPEIVVLTGMRQVGKTTVLRMVYSQIKNSNKVFLDMENPLDRKIFEEEDYNNVWANLTGYGIRKDQKAYVFLDEIQAMPKIAGAMKYLYDHYQTKFFVSGSSSFYLKNLFSESLSGRKIIFELYPLDFSEFLQFKGRNIVFESNLLNKDHTKNAIVYEGLKKFYDEYVEFGGFPGVVTAPTNEYKKERLRDIFKSYFEKDVQIMADFREINVFRDLLLLLLSRVGSKLDVSKLSREVGVTRETIYSYLSFLQGTYFMDLITIFSNSIDRRVSGAKKVYCIDTGLINCFAKVSEGSLFENSVYVNLRKYGPVNYYQKGRGSEIDFIIADLKIGIEVKSRGEKSDLKKLQNAGLDLGLSESFVVTREFTNMPGFIPALML